MFLSKTTKLILIFNIILLLMFGCGKPKTQLDLSDLQISVIKKNGLKITSSPDNQKPIGRLNYRKEYPVTDIRIKKIKILFSNDQEFWLHLSPQENKEIRIKGDKAEILSKELSVFATPDSKTPIGKVLYKEKYRVLKIIPSHFKVKAPDGKEGWVPFSIHNKKVLRIVSGEENLNFGLPADILAMKKNYKVKVIKKGGISVRADLRNKGNTFIGAARYGDVFDVYEELINSVKISFGTNQQGWIYVGTKDDPWVKISDNSVEILHKGGITIREKPSYVKENNSRIGVAFDNNYYNLRDKYISYYYIMLPSGDRGWIYGGTLEDSWIEIVQPEKEKSVDELSDNTNAK